MVVVWALAACGPPARAGALDGLVLDYDVMRNGGSIGSHVVRFREADGRLVVETSVRIEVTFVFITLYRYALDATETWLDGRLVALSSATDDDGERLSVRAAADGDALRVETGAGAGWTAPGTIAPSSLWRRDMLGHGLLLDMEDGTGLAVSVTREDAETVTARGRPVTARRYVVRGDLERELWYDADGVLVHVRFKGRDGSEIVYVLR